ncbi:MAG TPA: hypothetical protein VJ955_01465, partial [Desulfuromonadales bacterium]|nr:hypothetical protein [Desulfuromonadales bacterium]
MGERKTHPETGKRQAFQPRRVSLRHSLFLRFGLLMIVAMVFSTVGYLRFGIHPAALRIAESRFDVAAQQVEISLNRVFNPAENLIGVARRWALKPGFATSGTESFDRLFYPILKQIPQITSAVAGTSDGQGWMLLQRSDDHWLSRYTDVRRDGSIQHFTSWQGDGPRRSYHERLDYDPRQRPWFQLAASGADNGHLHWTAPYTFFTTKDPGITVSVRRDLPDGRTLVVGFDIKLLDVSRTTDSLKVGDHGCALVLTADRRVLGLPRGATTDGTAQIRRQVLEPVSRLSLPAVRQGMATWRTEHRPAKAILRFSVEGKQWLGTFRPFVLGEQTFWVAIFAPKADFTPSSHSILTVLSAILALVLALTLLIARRQARLFSAPLEMLAADSEKI